jgi:membrane-associated phospholipid phosphatase
MGANAAQPRPGPPEQRLADRLTARQMPAPTSARATAVAVLGEVGQVDLAVYRAIAGSATPLLDRPMRRLSAAANWSRLWLVVGGAMAVAGGPAGRRAAGAGLVALAVDAAVVVNIGLKVAARRGRPDRDSAGVPTARRVPMPASTSFPSGHSASGFAFTNAVAHTLPAAAGPLGLLASAVGYARVHTGVHYPGDVIIGAVVGTAIGEAVGWGTRRLQAIPRAPLWHRRGRCDPTTTVAAGPGINPMELFVRGGREERGLRC